MASGQPSRTRSSSGGLTRRYFVGDKPFFFLLKADLIYLELANAILSCTVKSISVLGGGIHIKDSRHQDHVDFSSCLDYRVRII
jgi:hypothetical protein